MGIVRSLVFRVVAFALVAVVLAGAGWWVFVREDNKAQTEAGSITDEVRQAASTPTSAAGDGSVDADVPAGTSTYRGQPYRIIAEQTSAWYLAPEKLASLPTSSVAKGTTTDVRGEFHVGESGLDPSQPTVFTIGLANLKSDQSRRDGRVQSALEVSKYPEAVFTAKTLSGLPETLPESEANAAEMQLTGTLDLHGVQRDVTFDVKAFAQDGIISVLGTTTLRYADFNITRPEVANFVTVEEELTLQIQLYAAPA